MMENRKPIITIVTGIFPPDIGGPASYVPKIARELVNLGWKVTVVTLSDSLDYDDDIYPFRVVRLLRPQNKLFRVPKTIWTIAKYAKSADLIFSNGLFPESVIASKIKRKPLVMKIVGDWAWERSTNKGWIDDPVIPFQEKRYKLQVETLKKIRSFAVKRANIIFTPSYYVRGIVEKWGVSSDRIHVIYNALELAVDNIQPIQLGYFEGWTAITVGRLLPLKGIDRIIRVISSLPNIRLAIVGDGPEMKNLQKLATDFGLNSRIIFTGQVSAKSVPQYLKSADLFILNSYVEGLPFVILEAMMVGLPVIATNVGGTGEVVQNEVNGLLIPPKDDEALRSAIVELIQNPDKRKKFVEAGYQTIKEKFRWESLVESTEKLLLSVMQNTIKG